MNEQYNEHLIDAETVHNWRNCYHNKPYFRDLTKLARAAMFKVHDEHHKNGLNAADAVAELIETFPTEFGPMYY